MKRIILIFLFIFLPLIIIGCNPTEPFIGQWVVSKIAGTGRIYAMSEAEMQAYIGKNAEYRRTLAVFDKESCKNPIYQRKNLSEADFVADFRIPFKNLGLKETSVTVFNIYESPKNPWANPGSYLIIKNKKTLITVWDGVFFEMKRKSL